MTASGFSKFSELAGSAHLVVGVGWRTGEPSLDVVRVADREKFSLPLIDSLLSFRVESDLPFCTGRYGFSRSLSTVNIVCPDQSPAVGGGQCSACTDRDEFRFVHHVHKGGYIPDSLATYLKQPHWVYIATFGDGISKVGTAADGRKRSRLDEQSAVFATYVAEVSNGYDVRVVEDAVSAGLGLTQYRRRSAKISSLTRRSNIEDVRAAHGEVVSRAVELLGGSTRSSAIRLVREPWRSASSAISFIELAPLGGWHLYPHRLQMGVHRFSVIACTGSIARIRDADGEIWITDLAKMKGIRIEFGDFGSPSDGYQSALF